MRYYEHRAVLHQAVHALLYQRFRAGIYAGRGFIQYQHRGIRHRRAGYCNKLPLALGKIRAVRSKHGIVTFRQMRNEVMRIGKLCRAHYFLIRCIKPAVAYVFAHGAGEKMRILQHHAKRAAQRRFLYLPYGYAVVCYAPALNIVEAVYKVRYGCLARAGGAYKGYLLTRLCVKRNVFQHVHLAVVAEGNVFKAHVPAHADKLARGLFPCPNVRALAAFFKLAFFVHAGVYHNYVALVLFRLFVKQGEYPLRARKRAEHVVRLLAYFGHGHGEASGVLQKRAQRANVYYSGNAQQSAACGNYCIGNVGQVVHYRPHYAGKRACGGGVPPKGFVQLVKAAVHGLLVAEYLYHLLPLYHFLNIAVHLAHAVLPRLEEAAGAARYCLGNKHHYHQHQYGYARKYGVEHDHHCEYAYYSYGAAYKAWQALAYHFAHNIGIVGVGAHYFAVRALIKVAYWQRLHLGEHFKAQLQKRSGGYVYHKAVIHKRAQYAYGVHGCHNDKLAYKAGKVGIFIAYPRYYVYIYYRYQHICAGNVRGNACKQAYQHQHKLPTVRLKVFQYAPECAFGVLWLCKALFPGSGHYSSTPFCWE